MGGREGVRYGGSREGGMKEGRREGGGEEVMGEGRKGWMDERKGGMGGRDG